MQSARNLKASGSLALALRRILPSAASRRPSSNVAEEVKKAKDGSGRSADLVGMYKEIHSELDAEIRHNSELKNLAKYYFDGHGKAMRPVIAMTLAHALNRTLGNSGDEGLLAKQKRVAMVSEMIHTASLIHDDVLDKADTRRGKEAVNVLWNATSSTMAGDYVIAVCSKLIAQIRNEEVVIVLSQVLLDLVQGEFQQLSNAKKESERFQLYLNKTFNKTASLIACTCKANAILSTSSHGSFPLVAREREDLVESAYLYGTNVGIAFQLVDDLLDFVSSSEQLGKPAAADMRLGLATAPVLFASSKHPQLEPMIARRFKQAGDVEAAFDMVLQSDGLERTKELALKHSRDALHSLRHLADSEHKDALMDLADSVVNRVK